MGKPVKELTAVQRVIAIITIIALLIYAIINIALVLSAYLKLSTNVGVLLELIENWQTGTIQDLTVAAVCPTGYESALKDRYWDGVQAGCWCGNVNSNTLKTKKITCTPFCTSACTADATKAGCTNIPSKSPQILNYWTKNAGISGGYAQICIQRSSENYASMAPLTTSTGTCPTGYTKCGSSKENVFCTKQTKCPINSITVASVASTTGCTTAGNCAVLMSNSGSYKTITYTRGDTTDKIPSSQFTINEYGMCELKSTDNITPNRPQFALNRNKDTTCNTAGNVKWTVTDSTTEDQVFAANGLTTYISSLSTYTDTKTGMTGYYQNSKSGSDYTWNLFTRRYIPWHVNCRDEMHNLMDKSTFVKKLRTAQLAVVVIGCISGFILGVVLAVMEIMNLRGTDLPCISGKGEEERIKLRRIKSIMSYLFKLIQVPFQIWAIVLCGSAKHLLIAVASRKCSDDNTNATLVYIAKTLSATYSSTITALGLLVVSVIIDLILSAWRKKDDKKTVAIPISGTPEQDKSRIHQDQTVLYEETTPGVMQTRPSYPPNRFPPPPQPQYPQGVQPSQPLRNNGPNVAIQLQTMPQQNPVMTNQQYPAPMPQYNAQQYPPQYPPQQQYIPQQQYPQQQQQYPPQQQYPQQQYPQQQYPQQQYQEQQYPQQQPQYQAQQQYPPRF